MSGGRESRLSALHRRLDRQETIAGMVDSLADGLCWAAFGGLVAFVLLMPRATLRAVEAMAMIIGGM